MLVSRMEDKKTELILTASRERETNKIIIQFNWSLISHNLELAWRKHGGHCVIYFMFVREFLLIPSLFSAQPVRFNRVDFFRLHLPDFHSVVVFLHFIFCVAYVWMRKCARLLAAFLWFFLFYNLLSVCSIRLQPQFKIPSSALFRAFDCFLSSRFALLVAHHTHSHTRKSLTHTNPSVLATHLKMSERKRKTQKSFIIVIWGAVMYQYPCWMAKAKKNGNNHEHNSCWF